MVDICWVNNFTVSQAKEAFRRLALDVLAKDLYLETVHWGFKEIRYRNDHNALEFLCDAFPDCRMIFVSGILSRWSPVPSALGGRRSYERPRPKVRSQIS